MLYQNTPELIKKEAAKLVASYKLGIKTDFSICLSKLYLLNHKLND